MERSDSAGRAGQIGKSRRRTAGSKIIMTSDDMLTPRPQEQADENGAHDRAYADALGSVRHAIEQFGGCSHAEKTALAKELADLQAIAKKLEEGRVEIVLFGEIDTGKSALINALV